MTITLSHNQERAIQDAIRAGLFESVDEFVESAIRALPHRERNFDPEEARRAGARIRELRRGVSLDRRGLSIREMAHIGHKY